MGVNLVVKYQILVISIIGIKKESILNHIYIKDMTIVLNMYTAKPEIGDHKLIIVQINESPFTTTTQIKHNWKNYSVNSLNESLGSCDFNDMIENIWQYWNKFENVLIGIVDKLLL